MVKLNNQTIQKTKKNSLVKKDDSSSEESKEELITDKINDDDNDDKYITKQLKIDKRKSNVRSEKQLAHFENMRKKRIDNIEKINLNKKIEASKILLQHDKEQMKNKKYKKIESESESSEEEEIIIIEKKKKPKKKTKRIIIEESSDSEEEPEEEEEIIKPKIQRNFKSQQNKKSIIKIHKPNQEINTTITNVKKDFNSFFI